MEAYFDQPRDPLISDGGSSVYDDDRAREPVKILSNIVVSGRHNTRHNAIRHNDTRHKSIEYHYAECRDYLNVMLNVIRVNVVVLSVVALTVRLRQNKLECLSPGV
jgi:hypothetical protein